MSTSANQPRLIIHGGAGNVTRENLPRESYLEYSAALQRIHRSTSELLSKGATALDAATHAVTLFEDCPFFNCGKGAVSGGFEAHFFESVDTRTEILCRSLLEMALLNWRLR